MALDTILSFGSTSDQFSRACNREVAIPGTSTAFCSFLSTTINVPSRPFLRLANFMQPVPFFDFVIPAKARIQNYQELDTGFRRYDGINESSRCGIEMFLDGHCPAVAYPRVGTGQGTRTEPNELP